MKCQQQRLQQEHDVKQRLESRILRRRASLTDAEAFFLHSLLVDDDDGHDDHANDHLVQQSEESKEGAKSDQRQERMKRASAVLDDDILFSIPFPLAEREDSLYPTSKLRRASNLGLWKAHADGVPPRKLVQIGASLPEKIINKPLDQIAAEDLSTGHLRRGESKEDGEEKGEDADAASDQEVRKETRDDMSEGSSWSDHMDHYDAWEVLKDEYAEDFGFNYSTSMVSTSKSLDTVDAVAEEEEEQQERNTFQILGTSVDDASAQPHVMSPPLMYAIMSHLPLQLLSQNYWLKFSLVRDGASLETLKQYVRASQHTVIAIETVQGEVFGSFTSSPWRTHPGFFGTGQLGAAFVWKMKNSRQTKCHSLFDQARLESEIDVFRCDYVSKDLVQLCQHDVLAVGGDESVETLHDGFAFLLEADLLQGTTSSSNIFHSPALCGKDGSQSQTFQVAGLEVWTFTPCFDVAAAERLEMTKFFIEESTSRRFRSTLSPTSCTRPHADASSRDSSGEFSSLDLDQEKFYRRVGYDPEGEERRNRWQYRNMMEGGTDFNRGLGATPRYSS